MKILPVDFINGQPLNAELWQAAETFCHDQFNRVVDLKLFVKVWVCLGEDDKVRGIIAIQNKLDIPLFHLADPQAKTREGLVEFVKTNDALIDRAKNYIADLGGIGSEVFVHVAPEARDHAVIKRNLKRLAARESNRVIVDIV